MTRNTSGKSRDPGTFNRLLLESVQPIVLLTDFGTKDAYAASMKGVLLSLAPGAVIVDLTHEIAPQNVKQAAFVLEAAYSYFPRGSIFVSVVDPGVGSERRILAARTARGIFLAPDNGLLTRVLEKEKPSEIRIVTNPKFFLKKISSTFHGRDCFAPTAARLAQNPSLFARLGPLVKSFKKLDVPSPCVTSKGIRGEILYFDHFGNAFTNISKGSLNSKVKRVKLQVRVRGKTIGAIRRSYFEEKRGRPVAVLSSCDLLEIAVNQGSARRQLKLREGEKVEVF